MKPIHSIDEFNSRIKRILITKEEIDEAIKKAGKEIDKIYDGRPILLVSILKGAFVFMADLCRAVSVPSEIGFMCAKSYYEGTVSSGVVKITMDLDKDISKYHVVIVEDIIDTGRTLSDIVKLLPSELLCEFTQKELSIALKLPYSRISYTTGFLLKNGIISITGKRGREHLYKINPILIL